MLSLQTIGRRVGTAGQVPRPSPRRPSYGEQEEIAEGAETAVSGVADATAVLGCRLKAFLVALHKFSFSRARDHPDHWGFRKKKPATTRNGRCGLASTAMNLAARLVDATMNGVGWRRETRLLCCSRAE